MSKVIKHKRFNEFLNKCELAMHEIGICEFPIQHQFSDGIYMREMFLPKGACLTSKIHKTEYPYILSAGLLYVISKDEEIILKAPYTGFSKKGTRRMGIAIEDCIFTSIHANPDNCKDIPTLEKRLFKTYDNPLLKNIKLEVVK